MSTAACLHSVVADVMGGLTGCGQPTTALPGIGPHSARPVGFLKYRPARQVHVLHRGPRPQHHSSGRPACAAARGRMGLHARVAALCRRHCGRHREPVGIDMGLTVWATRSDETRFCNPKALAAAWAELRLPDRAIARSRNAHGRGIVRPTGATACTNCEAVNRPVNCVGTTTRPPGRSPGQKPWWKGRDAERARHGEEQAAGALRLGCRHGRVGADAGYRCVWQGTRFVKVDP